MNFRNPSFTNLILGCSLFCSMILHGQNTYIPDSHIPFQSKFIQILDDRSGWIKVIPLDSTIDFTVNPIPLNEEVFMNSFITVLNQFRKGYGRKPLRYSPEISENLKNSTEYGIPLNGISYSSMGFYRDYNYVTDYPNREFMFGEFLIDQMKITLETFQTLVSSKVQTVGYYFKQNREDGYYDFMIFIQ